MQLGRFGKPMRYTNDDMTSTSPLAQEVAQSLLDVQSPPAGHASDMASFFKAYEGGYGKDDQFLGITVPVIRRVAKQYRTLSLPDVEQLLDSQWHEVRQVGLTIMADQSKSKRTPDDYRKEIYDLYLRRTDAVNNWDLVDTSCYNIVGMYLLSHPEQRMILSELAHSKNIWERRIAMVSTWQLIREGQLDETFTVATMLLNDKHDLIHKAVGWMLREAGKRDEARLRLFLTAHIRQLPRTSLRYAIERFAPEDRAYFLKLK